MIRALFFTLIAGCAAEPCVLDSPGDTITISSGSVVEHGGISSTTIACKPGALD